MLRGDWLIVVEVDIRTVVAVLLHVLLHDEPDTLEPFYLRCTPGGP